MKLTKYQEDLLDNADKLMKKCHMIDKILLSWNA